MQKLQPDDLFQLIQSLTKEEKRYFKLFAKNMGKESSNYVVLFDILDKQPAYDESALKQKWQRQKFNVQLLSSYKQYLYQLILKALQNLHQEASVEEEILTGLKQLKILYRKQLTPQVKTLHQKLLELCKLHDKVFYLPRLYEWGFLIQNAVEIYRGWTLEQFETAHDTFMGAGQHLLNYIQHRQHTSRTAFYLRHLLAYSRSSELQQWVESYPVEKPATTDFSAYLAYLQGRALRLSALRDAEQTMQTWLELADYVEQHPKALTDIDIARIYSGALVAAMGFAADLKQYSIFEQCHERLARIDIKKLPPWIHLLYLQQKQLLFIRTGQFEQGAANLEILQDFINSTGEAAFPPLFLQTGYFGAAVIHIGLEQWDKSLTYLQQVLDAEISISHILYNLARTLYLLVHYEKKEFLLMPYSVRSVYRSLLKDQHLYEFERLFLRGLRRLSQAADKTETQKTLLILRKKLKKFDWNAPEIDREPLQYFDYIAWVESKIKGCTLAEILQQRHLS